MERSINRITLRGFKSIRSLKDFELKGINVLIGANGSGKSNFVSFFPFLHDIVEGRLHSAVDKSGGSDALLHLGPKVTSRIEASLEFGMNGYEFILEPTVDERLVFAKEAIKYYAPPMGSTTSVDRLIGEGHGESALKKRSETGWNREVAKHVYTSIASWTVFHVHDTSGTAAMRRSGTIRDNEQLLPDAGNLAAFLYMLREEEREVFNVIVETVQLVAPFFREFRLRPRKKGDDQVIRLEWRQQGSSYPFLASQLSDGTLRFIALATLLLQPYPPATILIDEPELGLHPYALEILGNLILQAELRTQIIISTQSAQLLNAFSAEQIVVVDRKRGRSSFKRLDKEQLKEWLDDYSIGELWAKNVYGGGPSHE